MSWPMMPPAGSGNCTVASTQVSLAVMWSLSHREKTVSLFLS